MASGDRFVSFKAGRDRRDDSFFFYRAGYRMAGREERQKKSHQKIILLLIFLVVGDTCVWIRSRLHVHNQKLEDATYLSRDFLGHTEILNRCLSICWFFTQCNVMWFWSLNAYLNTVFILKLYCLKCVSENRNGLFGFVTVCTVFYAGPIINFCGLSVTCEEKKWWCGLAPKKCVVKA